MHTIISAFETTPIVPASAQGPYVVPAGSPVTLTAQFTHPDATYAWDLGDGNSANTASVTHTYFVQGTYIAKLTVVVHQPGGAESRSFACVRVLDVAATVDAGPDRTVNEGDLVELAATFTDPELSLNHVAIWRWGDNQSESLGSVVETHQPPLAKGTVTGTHAWGDSGTYGVTLLVRDSLGATGIGTLKVDVLNVPPTVCAGPAMFAYPRFVLTLKGDFTDPGWLDTHSGSWNFGDGTGVQPATIRECNEPPSGRGIAIASHVFASCGTYEATCTVTDDDGASGHATTVVRVVDIENANFERGFAPKTAGDVANHWHPYAATIAAFQLPSTATSPKPGTFRGELFCVHGGERAQRIVVDDASRAGIHQHIGANPGWVYEVRVCYAVSEQSAGMVRLGVDPFGRTDANAPEIVWSVGRRRGAWKQLTVRVAAKCSRITIFLEAIGRYQPTAEELEDAADESEQASIVDRADRANGIGVDAIFDSTRLIPIQPLCVPEDCEVDSDQTTPEQT